MTTAGTVDVRSRRRRLLPVILAAGALTIAAALTAGALAIFEPPIPAAYRAQVGAAAQVMSGLGDDRRQFRFHSIRCRADGGLVVVFDSGDEGADSLHSLLSFGPADDPASWSSGGPLFPYEDPSSGRTVFPARQVPCPGI